MTQRQKLKTVIPLSKNLQFWLELSVSLWYMLKLMHNKSCSYSTSIIVYSLNIHVSMLNVVCSMKITFNNRNIIWSFFYFDINTYFILRVSIIEPYAWYEIFTSKTFIYASCSVSGSMVFNFMHDLTHFCLEPSIHYICLISIYLKYMYDMTAVSFLILHS